MAALSKNRNTKKFGETAPTTLQFPIADNVHVYGGGMVAISAGAAQPATAATGLTIVGRAVGEYNNTLTGHAAGSGQTLAYDANGRLVSPVLVEQGVFGWDSGAGADAITGANVGARCYAIDDHTVGLTDGNGARSVAGEIVGYDTATSQVMVAMQQVPEIQAIAEMVISIGPYPLASIAAADLLATPITMKRAGKIAQIEAIVTTAATTAAKLATVTPSITPSGGAEAVVTGGAVALTSANCTPVGAQIAGSAITAANTFNAGDAWNLKGSGVTAFVEGAVQFLVHILPAS